VAALAALPALAGGLPPWVGEGIQAPFAVVNPGAGPPAAGDTGQDPADAGAGSATTADPAAPDDRAAGDDHDREDDDDSGGSGRSGGGGSSGPG
jgi:hypothetical protein